MVKVNLGCGGDHIPGYLSLDRKNFDGKIDIICDLEKGKLPFKDGSVDEFIVKHCLEHLSSPEIIISECYRALKPGGLLHIIGPHYSHPNNFVFVHKNYWGINCKILFDGSYHEFEKWSKVEWDVNFANRNGLKQKILKPFIKRYPSIYEAHFAMIMPIAEIQFMLTK